MKSLISKQLIIQALKFFAISGVGWIMDFAIFCVLTKVFGWNVWTANIVSSIPAITYVFIVSTRKIFKNLDGKLSLKMKYLIYVTYQILFVIGISFVAEGLYTLSLHIDWHINFLVNNMKIFIKIFITPITMLCNFIFMKILLERINISGKECPEIEV